MRYAKGTKSVATSDISGFKVPYKSLKRTWQGYYVEPEEWDPKHPQLTPAKNVIDATALLNPRPGNNRQEDAEVFIGYNYDPFLPIQQRPPVGVPSFGVVGNTFSPEIDLLVTGVAGTGATGTITEFETDVVGVAGTGALGVYAAESEITETGVAGTGNTGTAVANIVISVPVTGLTGTGALGTFSTATTVIGLAGIGALGAFTLESEITETGVAGTGALGTTLEESEIAETGVAGTGAVHILGESDGSSVRVQVDGVVGVSGIGTTGNEVAVAEITETGLGGTGAIGTAEPAQGWGQGGWGEQGWGYGI